MYPYREEIESRICNIEHEIEKLKLVPKKSMGSFWSKMSKTQRYAAIAITFLVFCFITCGTLLSIGYGESLAKGLGFAMIPIVVICGIIIGVVAAGEC